MKIRKRKIGEPVPTPKKERAYVHVYRVGDGGLKDKANSFHHKGPSPITMLHVEDFGGVVLETTLDELYGRLARIEWVVRYPGKYFTLSTHTQYTTNFVVHSDGSITRGFPYGT